MFSSFLVQSIAPAEESQVSISISIGICAARDAHKAQSTTFSPFLPLTDDWAHMENELPHNTDEIIDLTDSDEVST